MPDNFVDDVFVKEFKAGIIDHLKKEYRDDAGQNQPKKIIDEAISQGAGKLSRLFDTFKVSTFDRESFNQGLQQAGSIESYMRPILNELASELLNEDKSALNVTVIEAIGIDKYAQLTGGQVIEKLVVAGPKQSDFNARESEIARIVMSAVIVNYAQGVDKLIFTDEQRTLKKQQGELAAQVVVLSTFVPESNSLIDMWEKEDITLNNDMDVLAKSVTAACQLAKSTSENGDEVVLKSCYKIKRQAEKYLNDTSTSFAERITTPLDVMANQFNFDMLEERAPKISLEELTEKAIAFHGMANRALSEARNFVTLPENAENSEQYNNIICSLDNLVGRVDEAIQVPGNFSRMDNEGLRDKMLAKYNDALTLFKETIRPELIKAEPPKPLMNIIVRVLRAIFIWDLTTSAEKADQNRFKKETIVADELNGLMEPVDRKTQLSFKSQLKSNRDSESKVLDEIISPMAEQPTKVVP
jgi:hypothetical protein